MKLVIASTRAGLKLKDAVKEWLEQQGHTVDDVGMKEGGEFVPYYESAARVARAVAGGQCALGIAVCGTGAGSAIVANKFRGVYAVQAGSEYEAARATIINNANVLCLGEWITPPQHAIEIVKAWLDAEFTAGFEADWQQFLRGALRSVQSIEAENMK